MGLIPDSALSRRGVLPIGFTVLPVALLTVGLVGVGTVPVVLESAAVC